MSKRRSSYDILHGIAGSASSLPLPKRVEEEGGTGMVSPTKRGTSPTRSLSRIPVAAVGNARALADDGSLLKSLPATDLPPTSACSLSTPSPSPQTKRLSPGGTTKVLADLQAGVIHARNALENTKSQLRLSQRTVASLTRKVEDLKEVEERLRIENEGLNNVVARKERLLQEVLERARKAEAEAASLKQHLKQETSTSKKTIREMETQLAESTALSKKSEREYITLRDSMRSMSDTWKLDIESLKLEMRKREDKWRKEVDGVGNKYKDLCLSVKEKEHIMDQEWKVARDEDKKRFDLVERVWTQQVEKMRDEVDKSGRDCEKAERTAQDLALDLTILKKWITNFRTVEVPSEPDNILP